MKKRWTWTALALVAALMLSFAAPANCGAQDARILLMRCRQQDGRAEAVYLDEAGGVWQYQSDDPLPDADEERLAFLTGRSDAALVRQLDANRVRELESLIDAAGEPQMAELPDALRDCGMDAYSAARYGVDGAVEIIPLAAAGYQAAENLESNAYALYLACFTEVMGYDLEAELDAPLKPTSPRCVPLAEFLGVDAGALEGATLTAGRMDCEAGYIDLALDEDEAREKLAWLCGLVVTGKRNALYVTGDMLVYTLCSANGEPLATVSFYQGLLVTDDGMYAVEPGV